MINTLFESRVSRDVRPFVVVFATILSLVVSSAHGAATITTLYSFTGGSDGANPASALVQDSDGKWYGTTVQGGVVNSANGGLGSGTVFCLTTNGVLNTLHTFSAGSDGSNPYGLIWGTDGWLYGTTDNGGYDERNNPLNGGTVFKISPQGDLDNLWVCAPYALSGARPNGLAWGQDGNLYGTAMIGGGQGSHGTLFQMTPQGTMNYYIAFDGTNGSYPNGNLCLGADGNFYGTTHFGGTNGVGLNGTTFRMTPGGQLTRLCEFPNSGEILCQPNGSLVQGQDGSLYGTTFGSVFVVMTNGAYAPIYAFNSGADGYRPYAGLIRGTDGELYGMTSDGGQYYSGTLFKITTNGVLTTLASFGGTNGASPRSALTLGQDGNFYGTTWSGGASNAGTIFRVTITPDPAPITPPITISLKSDASTLAASLGTNTASETSSRLENGDISGLSFEPAMVGEYDGWIVPPKGLPASGVQRINIPPGDGASGFYKVSFELPAGFWSPQLIGRATVLRSGGAFLNGNRITPNLSERFETTDAAFFKTGMNELVISDANFLSSQYGFLSGAAFSIFVSYQPAPVLHSGGLTDGMVRFSWKTVVGKQYQLQYKTNLVQSIWSNVGDTITATNANAAASVSIEAGQRFYRVQLVQ